MTIAIIYHPACLLHDMGYGHPERPERVQVVQEALERYPFKGSVAFYKAPEVTRAQLEWAHDKHYLTRLEAIAPAEGRVVIDEDTLLNPHTLEAARRAAGAVIHAVDLVKQDKAQAAFCNVRPPGHHAEHNKAMGFCFYNNVAVGVLHALEHYRLERIAIIDFDLHHGNGTQDIFQHDPRVLYCSSFEFPLYPGYDATLDNEHILSVPLRAGTQSHLYREVVKAAWFAKLVEFQPQLVFFSAGFDGHKNDPLGNLQMTKEDYVWLTQQVVTLTAPSAGGKVISVLEGGYNLQVLVECVPAHVEALIAAK